MTVASGGGVGGGVIWIAGILVFPGLWYPMKSGTVGVVVSGSSLGDLECSDIVTLCLCVDQIIFLHYMVSQVVFISIEVE